VYDFLLGGKDNYAIDRDAAEKILAVAPELRANARANRAFLARAVRYLAGERGIRQFLDIGTGIPAAGNTHEVAQGAAPESGIVYVDNDHCKSGCLHVPRAPNEGDGQMNETELTGVIFVASEA
jgi:S-adenosyl methyltransferase